MQFLRNRLTHSSSYHTFNLATVDNNGISIRTDRTIFRRNTITINDYIIVTNVIFLTTYTYTNLNKVKDQINHVNQNSSNTTVLYVPVPMFIKLIFQINVTRNNIIQYDRIDFCLNQNTYDVKRITDTEYIRNQNTRKYFALVFLM